MVKTSVYIEEITSGSFSKKVFTFLDQHLRPINVEPFALLQPNEFYPHPHHIDEGNFDTWLGRTGSQIFPYDKNQHGKLSDWGEDTKAVLRRLIRDGHFDTAEAEFVLIQRIYEIASKPDSQSLEGRLM